MSDLPRMELECDTRRMTESCGSCGVSRGVLCLSTCTLGIVGDRVSELEALVKRKSEKIKKLFEELHVANGKLGSRNLRIEQIEEDLRVANSRIEQLEARHTSPLRPTGEVARGTAGEVTVVDVAGDGTGPWKLFLGEFGVAQWPSRPADEDPQGYAVSVAQVIQGAISSEHGPCLRGCEHPEETWRHVAIEGALSYQRLATWCGRCGALNTGTWKLPSNETA